MTKNQTQQLIIDQPDDWHLHLRDNEALKRTVTDTSRYFSRAIIMPNLQPPVVNAEQAQAYKQRITAELAEDSTFLPLMTLYLTDNTTPEMIKAAKESGDVYAVKLYPAGATTNSDAGVTDIKNCYATLAEMEKQQLPLLVHGEVTSPEIDIFDREKVFIERVLSPLRKDFPSLKVVFEHITTADAAAFVSESAENLAATITPHHLLLNRNDLLVGGIRPHHYCLPVLKRSSHQEALIKAATSGSNKFFLGTDSAPHLQSAKESSCGCAGIYSAHAAIEFYAEAFEAAGALDKLEGFASHHGPDFYGLPRNTKKLVLEKEVWQVPAHFDMSGEKLVPLRADGLISWKAHLAN